jgi:hypothetical protein
MTDLEGKRLANNRRTAATAAIQLFEPSIFNERI